MDLSSDWCYSLAKLLETDPNNPEAELEAISIVG